MRRLTLKRIIKIFNDSIFDNNIVAVEHDFIKIGQKRNADYASLKLIEKYTYVLGHNLGVDNVIQEEHSSALARNKIKSFRYFCNTNWTNLPHFSNYKTHSLLILVKYYYVLGYNRGFDEAMDDAINFQP